jgi:hypothetical protein
MPPYYRGPMPTTDEERSTMRAQALAELRRMKDSWEQTAKTSRYGRDALLPATDQASFNESVHKLMIATGEPNPARYYYTARPVPKGKKDGLPFDGVQISALLTKADTVLRDFETEQ